MAESVLIIGSGVIGLSTAVCVQEKLPHCTITLVSELFPHEDIVSMVAGSDSNSQSDVCVFSYANMKLITK